MANELQKLKELKNWVNSDKFPASAYNYERNLLLKAIELVEAKLDTIEYQKIILSDDEPTTDVSEGDIWLDS